MEWGAKKRTIKECSWMLKKKRAMLKYTSDLTLCFKKIWAFYSCAYDISKRVKETCSDFYRVNRGLLSKG